MSMIKAVVRLRKMDSLIRREATGSPEEFARKMEVSLRRLYELIEEVKSMGVPITYSRCKKSYRYSEAGKIRMFFENSHLQEEQPLEPISRKTLG
ncbi:hypothetical protein KFE98_02255 [bacterium SCSIO 12741]|nr:hypothetical protein KFE98_02255 [bacterium SCSIO 12741]